MHNNNPFNQSLSESFPLEHARSDCTILIIGRGNLDLDNVGLAALTLSDTMRILKMFDYSFVRSLGVMNEFFGLLAELAHPTSLLVFSYLFSMLPIPYLRRSISPLGWTCFSTFIGLASMMYFVLIVRW